jgi:hypothetical protein
MGNRIAAIVVGVALMVAVEQLLEFDGIQRPGAES